MEKTNDGNRIVWLDVAKGFAIAFVVLGHVFLGYIGNNAFPSAHNCFVDIKNFIYLWHMPLFMFLSGFAFHLSTVSTGGQINKERIKRSVFNWMVVYLIFEIALSLSNVLFSDFVNEPTDIKEIVGTAFFPKNIMWYLWAIIIFYLCFPTIISSRLSPMIVFVLLSIVSIITFVIDDIYGVRRCFEGLFGYAIYFYVGILFRRSQEQNYEMVKNRRIQLVVISLLYTVIFLYLRYSPNYESWNVWIRNIMDFAAVWAIIILLLECFINVRKIGNSALLAALGKASLVIYVLHTYFVSAIKYAVLKTGYLDAVTAVIITFIVPVAITYFIYWTSKKIPWIGYLFKPYELMTK